MHRTIGSVLLLGTVALAACGDSRLAVSELEAPPAARTAAGDAALAREPGSGALYLAWVAGDSTARHIWFARSADQGGSWSEPVRVTGSAGDVGAPHGESAPRLVAGGEGRVALVWSRSVPVPGRRWPASAIRFSRSLDGGATWSETLTLNDDSTGSPGTHTFHGATWAGDSNIVAAWLDERGADNFPGHHHAVGEPAAMPTVESDARIFMTSSSDFGESWTPNRPVWGAVCPCCRVALARKPSGGVLAAWRQHFPGSIRDVVVADLLPEAGDPSRVHQDNWEYPGCPHTGPAMAVSEAGITHVVWYTGKPGGVGIYYARLAGTDTAAAEAVPLVTGTTVQTGHSAVVPLDDGGALAAFDVNESGERAIRIARIGAAGTVAAARTLEGSAGGTYPQLVALGDDSAVVAWRQVQGDSSRIRIARVTGL